MKEKESTIFPPFARFPKKLISEWRKLKMPFADETIVVAVSGGADSVALTLALDDLKCRNKLDLRFIVAHFNHNLRGVESAKDAEFVTDLAEKLGLEFVIQNPKSKIQNREGNLEQNARNARYEFLAEVAEKYHAFAVLTAHTLNDQAETFLMNLIRGSGIEGLGAMKIMRGFPDLEKSKIQLVRPLLTWAKRGDTEDFCREKGQEFRQDSMNVDEKFSRVRIRRQLLPLLATFNPKIVETLANTASLLNSENDLLETETRKYLKDENEFLVIKDLKELSVAFRRRVLRLWLKNRRGNLRQIDFRNIEAIERLIFSVKSGREIELPNGEIVARKDGMLIFYESKG